MLILTKSQKAFPIRRASFSRLPMSTSARYLASLLNCVYDPSHRADLSRHGPRHSITLDLKHILTHSHAGYLKRKQAASAKSSLN